MRFVALLAVLIGSATVAFAQAPAPLSPQPALPSPNVPQGSEVSAYLQAAQNAVAAGRKREAEEALEMAQTRMLDRSVPLGQTRNPSDNPTVGEITNARAALSQGDREGCLRQIQAALTSAAAQGL